MLLHPQVEEASCGSFRGLQALSLIRRSSEDCELTGGSYRGEDVGEAQAYRGSKVRLRHWER